MDVVLKTGNGRFNFRVCAIITNSGKLLAMRDENAPYYARRKSTPARNGGSRSLARA